MLINKISLISVLFLIVVIAACGKFPVANEARYPVLWSSEYAMMDYLEESVAVNDKEDLGMLLRAPWYAQFKVVYSKGEKETFLNTCDDYFSLTGRVTDTVPSSDYVPFVFLTKMCRVSKALVNGKGANKSYVPEGFLNRFMPDNFPKAMAFQVSLAQAERDANDISKQYWRDIEKNLQFEYLSENRIRFYGDGGVQVISLLARGDFDHDNIEDILLGVQQSVEGGTYSNFRALIFSVDKDKQWYLLKEL